MRSGGVGRQSRFMRVVTTPFRVLVKARDLYVRSLTRCANNVSFGGPNGCAASSSGGLYNTLPRSFSVSSVGSSNDSEDFRELVRAASARSLGRDPEVDLFLSQQLAKHQFPAAAKARGGVGAGVPRSCSVGMGRIDEDEACEDFGEDEKEMGAVGGLSCQKNKKKKSSLVFPRSKTYAVAGRILN